MRAADVRGRRRGGLRLCRWLAWEWVGAAVLGAPALAQPPQPQPQSAAPLCPPAAEAAATDGAAAGAGPGSAAGAASDAVAAAGVMPAPRDRGFLWRISRDGRDSYLYGTLHLGRPGWVAPGPRVAAALQASDVLALEIDIEDPAMARRLQAGVEAQRKLAQQRGFALAAEPAARLRRQLVLACLPDRLAEVMSPEFAVTTLMMLAGRADGLDAAWAADPALARAARALGKPVLSLETPEAQLALLHSKNADDARANVEKVLDELDRDEVRPMLRRLAQMWADSRFDDLLHYTDWCDCTGTARERAQLAALIDARNPKLADGIDALHRSGRNVFAAVGSLHMIGTRGLPALLAARGYTIERFDFAP